MPDESRHPADMTLAEFLAEFPDANPEMYRRMVDAEMRRRASADETALSSFKKEG